MSEFDPIVNEVRRIRDAHAAKFNFDPDAIFRDIKEQEERSGRKYDSFADETIAPNRGPQPMGAANPVAREIESSAAPGGRALATRMLWVNRNLSARVK